MEYAYHVFLLMGGIGMFLFGINFMGSGLERAAGDNLRVILQKLTKRSGVAVLVGAFVTAIIQSSGATMVMVAGFVNARLMELVQALYVMLGASIGTTVTAQIIALNIDPFAPLILFIGYILYKFVKSKSVRKAGEIILGFGLLFMGIYLMGQAIDLMSLGSLVESFLTRFNHPILSFLFGMTLTLIIQSSSAAVGILQVIVASSFASGFELVSVLYMVAGMNVGAVAPLVLSSIGGNRGAKRAALAQCICKLVSALFFIVLALIFPEMIDMIAETSPLASRQIANLHLVFNIVGAVILLPLIKPVSNLVMRLIPDDPDEEFLAPRFLYINEKNTRTGVLMSQLHQETMRFASMCVDNFKLATECFFTLDEEKCQKVLEVEETINYLNHMLNVFIMKLSASALTDSQSERLSSTLAVITDLERIADHAENAAEYAASIKASKALISPAGMSDLKKMVGAATKSIELSVRAFGTDDREFLKAVYDQEELVDDLYDVCIDNHIDRLKHSVCDPRGGVIYTDFVSELERCSDHAVNIAESVLGVDAPVENHE